VLETSKSSLHALMPIGLSVVSAAAFAAQPTVDIEFVTPDVSHPRTATQLAYGWPLAIRATISDELFIFDLSDSGAHSDQTVLEHAFVVFADAGGCYEMPRDLVRSCLATSPGETYIELSADHDEVDVVDSVGNDALIALSDAPGVSYSRRLNSGEIIDVEVGPEAGSGALDGVAYGANDDWPGLVLLSDHGIGVVLDSSFNRPPVAQRRNLAGLLESVLFELTDSKGRTRISAVTHAPLGLLGPVIQWDSSIGENNAAPGRYRVDGGPIQWHSNELVESFYEGLISSKVFALRAFVVSGIAPTVLMDANYDGRVDNTDASMLGYKVLSNEATVEVKIIPTRHLILLMAMPYDLDGNGIAGFGYTDEHGVGPGQIKKPPP
jgi:hypothetical protein